MVPFSYPYFFDNVASLTTSNLMIIQHIQSSQDIFNQLEQPLVVFLRIGIFMHIITLQHETVWLDVTKLTTMVACRDKNLEVSYLL